MRNRRRVGLAVALAAGLGVGACGGGGGPGGGDDGGQRGAQPDGPPGEPAGHGDAASDTGGEISGTVRYPADSLPEPGAVLSVRLVEGPDGAVGGPSGGATIAAATTPVEDRSVPVSFDLPYDTAAVDPGGSYALVGAIRDVDGTVRWTTAEPVQWSPGASDAVALSVEPVTRSEGENGGEVGMYRCAAADTFHFTVRTTGDEVAVHLPEAVDRTGLRVLGRARGGDGERAYTNGRGVVYVRRGGSVTLEVDDRRFEGCGEVRWDAWEAARIRGAVFRALGQEPGWYLEVYEGGPIRLHYDYGQERAAARTWEREQRPDGRVYLAETDAGRLTATVADEPCTDVMSGRRFESTVTVRLGEDRVLEGCGRVLRDQR